MSISIGAIIGVILLLIILYHAFRLLMAWAARGWTWPPAAWVELIWFLFTVIACSLIAWALGIDIPFIHIRA